MNMTCAAKQGVNDTVNNECFCSWLSDNVMIRNEVQNMNKRQTIFTQAKRTKLENEQQVY